MEKKLIFSNRRLNRSEIFLQSGCLESFRLFVHSAVELLLCMAVQQEEEEEEEQEKEEEEDMQEIEAS